MFGRSKIAMLVAEFLGTALLTITVLAINSGKSGVPYPFFVAMGVGAMLVVAALTLGRVSGGFFNPAITLGVWSIGKLRTSKAIVYVLMQLLGGFTAYLVYSYLAKTTWEDVGKYEPRVLVAEVLGTFIFSFGVAAAIYQKMESGVKAALIGLSLALGVIVATVASAGLLNPAIALGVRQWVWGTYVAGPIIGAILGFNLYSMLFAPVKAVVGKGSKEEIADMDDEDDEADVVETKPVRSAAKKTASKPNKKRR